MKNYILAAALFCLSGTGQAQTTKTVLLASNGVQIDASADEFAGRTEFTAPPVRFDLQGGGEGSLYIAKVKKAGEVGKLIVQGFMIYSGEWRYYRSAIFKGGDPVSYTRTGGKVGSCRYGCTLSESFSMDLAAADLAKRAEAGVVAVQLRAEGSRFNTVVNIPLSYVDAVNEKAR